jgi:hypothetical protein
MGVNESKMSNKQRKVQNEEYARRKSFCIFNFSLSILHLLLRSILQPRIQCVAESIPQKIQRKQRDG